ncbi:MAG: hypothetical protein HYS32_03335 [Candidatus Woesearchaeota archaeon]|nr:MAG: hypothetical protein HYS32_03335 [Candidatus Woesearchaeota archaeon]
MKIRKPCMVCEVNLATNSCRKCGRMVCNEHYSNGFCSGCKLGSTV